MAMPLALVLMEAEPPNAPLAPLAAGTAAKVTNTLFSGLPAMIGDLDGERGGESGGNRRALRGSGEGLHAGGRAGYVGEAVVHGSEPGGGGADAECTELAIGGEGGSSGDAAGVGRRACGDGGIREGPGGPGGGRGEGDGGSAIGIPEGIGNLRGERRGECRGGDGALIVAAIDAQDRGSGGVGEAVRRGRQ